MGGGIVEKKRKRKEKKPFAGWMRADVVPTFPIKSKSLGQKEQYGGYIPSVKRLNGRG